MAVTHFLDRATWGTEEEGTVWLAGGDGGGPGSGGGATDAGEASAGNWEVSVGTPSADAGLNALAILSSKSQIRLLRESSSLVKARNFFLLACHRKGAPKTMTRRKSPIIRGRKKSTILPTSSQARKIATFASLRLTGLNFNWKKSPTPVAREYPFRPGRRSSQRKLLTEIPRMTTCGHR